MSSVHERSEFSLSNTGVSDICATAVDAASRAAPERSSFLFIVKICFVIMVYYDKSLQVTI